MSNTITVDPEDKPVLDSGGWFLSSAGPGKKKYVVKRLERRGRKVYLHRVLMRAEPGQLVDHINGDTADNRRANLRICTNQENMRNLRRDGKSKGVSFRSGRPNKPWLAYITVDAKQKFLGYHGTELEAASAYNDAASTYFGEFANLNDLTKLK